MLLFPNTTKAGAGFIRSIRIAAFGTALLVADGTAAANDPGATNEYFTSALQLIDKRDYRGAIIQLKNALRSDPNDLSARIALGKAYLEVENGAAAAKELLHARRNGAQDRFVIVPLGRAYLLLGLYDKVLKELRPTGQPPETAAEIELLHGDVNIARRRFNEAIRHFNTAAPDLPASAKPHIGLARAYVGLHDMETAQKHAGLAIQVDPNNAEAWFVRGEISRQRRIFDDAMKFYDRSIELEPQRVDALLARAGLRIDRGEAEKAETDILKIRELNPDNPHAIYFHALVLASRGDNGAAQAALVQAENILLGYSSKFIEAHTPTLLLAGIVSYFRKNYATAYRYLSRHVELVPGHLGSRKLLASVALRRGEVNKVIELLERVVPVVPNDVDVLTMYGDALVRAKRYAEASKILERAANISEPGSDALSKLVVLQLAGGRDEDAIRLLEEELERDPSAVKAALMLTTALMRQQQFEDALKTIGTVIERQPRNPEAHNLAGGVRMGLRDVEGARKSFLTAYEVAPKYVPALFNLAKLETRLGNLDAAQSHYLTILEKNPKNGEAMLALAEIDQRRNDMEGAIRWLEKARSSSDMASVASLLLVDQLISAARPDQALLIAQKLHEQNPGNPEFMLALGRSRLASKRLEEAGDMFRELAGRAAEAKSPQWLQRSAVWLQKVRDLDSAREALEKALAINASFLPAHLELFSMDMSLGRTDDALARAAKVAAIDSGAATGRALKGDVYLHLRRFQDAATEYETAFRAAPSTSLANRVYRARRAAGMESLDFAVRWAGERPNDRGAQRLLAVAMTDAQRHRDAIRIYEKLLVAVPDDTAILNNVALLYLGTGDPRALDYARRAYEAAPDLAATMDTYGWALVRNGRISEGMRLLRNAKLRAPEETEIRYHLAVGLKALGRIDDAKRELRQIVYSSKPFAGMAEAQKLLEELSSSSSR